MSDGVFAPDRVITREELAAAMYRMIVKMNPDFIGNNTQDGFESYADSDEVSDWAKDAISVLIDKGIIKGLTPTKIYPKAYCTTEQAIAMLYRLRLS